MPTLIRPATPSDTGLVLQMIRELADYEKLSHEVVATEARLASSLFPADAKPFAECLLAFEEDAPAGFAVFLHNFSTFVGLPGVYLEDLFVRPSFRGRGHGKSLIREVARIACRRGCVRMEWTVLDWNAPSIAFYKSLGARHRPEWDLCRLEGDALAAFAGDASH